MVWLLIVCTFAANDHINCMQDLQKLSVHIRRFPFLVYWCLLELPKWLNWGHALYYWSNIFFFFFGLWWGHLLLAGNVVFQVQKKIQERLLCITNNFGGWRGPACF